MEYSKTINVFLYSQNFFHDGLRTLTLNAKYVCIFKNPRDASFVSIIGRQMAGNKRNHYMEQAFAECVRRPYGYMFLDLSQEQDDDLRIRNNVFPDQNCIVFKKK